MSAPNDKGGEPSVFAAALPGMDVSVIATEIAGIDRDLPSTSGLVEIRKAVLLEKAPTSDAPVRPGMEHRTQAGSTGRRLILPKKCWKETRDNPGNVRPRGCYCQRRHRR
jgi:hypothetical protein